MGMYMRISNTGSRVRYAMMIIALLLVGALTIGIVDTVYAQIAQPIAQTGGGVSIAQPIAQGGGFVSAPGTIVSAPFVARGPVPGYVCYQDFPGGAFTCYPRGPRQVVVSGGVYQYPGGVVQPVYQSGFGTQVAAPVAVI